MPDKDQLIQYYNYLAPKRDRWKKRNSLYHKSIIKYYSFSIPAGSTVLELGCSTGDLLHAVAPNTGTGIDFSPKMIEEAKKKYPQLTFLCADAEDFSIDGTFDFIILSDLLGSLTDIHKVLQTIRKLVNKKTRLIISNYNYLWEPILRLGELLKIKARQPIQNWLSENDIENLLYLTNFETIKVERKLLFPKYIPILNLILNRFLANLPLINHLNLISFIVARPITKESSDFSVSIVIPAKNEKGNIENALVRIPKMGKSQQYIFIEGHSSDGTFEEMKRVKNKYPDLNIVLLQQQGKGKGNAVREAFEKSAGDILMILDADLTTPPETLPKFFDALAGNKGEFINGCRLVYPMEKQAMRFLNLMANKFFGWLFTYILGQRLKDTLCGTKVLFRSDYIKIKENRNYFGDFDPFGDFDLLFGASKLNLKITEVIVRYREREYGNTQISRFKHGFLLLKMSLFAALKLKFRF
ncbi:MAG: glycosyltransferase [Bacteroidales bacterium]|nr:glycosyltransferase [Bacteroidales bacterium]